MWGSEGALVRGGAGRAGTAVEGRAGVGVTFTTRLGTLSGMESRTLLEVTLKGWFDLAWVRGS